MTYVILCSKDTKISCQSMMIHVQSAFLNISLCRGAVHRLYMKRTREVDSMAKLKMCVVPSHVISAIVKPR